MTIRPTTLDDSEAIVEIQVNAWRWAATGIVPDELIEIMGAPDRAQKIREMWDLRRANMVAEVSGRVVGFSRENLPVGLEGFSCELGSLYVHPDFTRQGVGLELFSSMASEFASRGHRSLCLQALRDNWIGRSFYDKAGGQVVGEGLWSGVPTVWYGWDDLSKLTSLVGAG